MAYPADTSHLSNLSRDDMIAQFGGVVESQFAKASIIRQYVPVRPLRGTDTLMNRRVGRTTLMGIGDAQAGQRPTVTATAFGKVQVTVDTIILARDNRALLNELQTDFNARAELAMDHGKELGKFFDQAFIIQGIKGALAAAPSGLNNAFGAGNLQVLDAAADELDPAKLAKGIRNCITKFAQKDIERSELVVFVAPQEFSTLLDADKLINTDYSAMNGDYAMGRVAMIEGARIVETNRIPNAAITGHPLSNAGNSNAYDISAAAGEDDFVAVVLHPRGLLAAESIPLTNDIWYNKEELMWFIDSYMAFGVTVNRPDACGGVQKYQGV